MVTQISQMTQIWLSLVPQISQIHTDFFYLSANETYSVRLHRIFRLPLLVKGYFRTKGDGVICSLCLAKLLYCGEVFDMHTLPDGIQ